MAAYLKSTAYTRMFKMIDSADHFSKKAGLTCTVNLSKAGGSFGAAGGTVTEVANGWYKIALNTTDTNTAGDLSFYITATGADDTDFCDQVRDPTSADLGVNVVNIGGTAQTARDLGASVLLSSGTAAGQLDFTSGVVKANTTQFAGQTVTAAAGVTLPASVASPTNITAGVITTVTNLTNAPTSGDFTSTMKTSLNAATPASVVGAVGSVTGSVGSVAGAVGSVTGNVGGNIVGSVASVTAGVTVTTNNDKTGYALSAAYDEAKTAAQAGDAMTLTSGERNSTADALLDRANGIETSLTLRQAQRLQVASAAGKLSGAATTSVTIRNIADSKDRIVATVDADGNRTAITTDLT